MRVAGFGFRRNADLASLRSALMQAGGAEGLTAVATLDVKASAPVFVALAKELGVSAIGLSPCVLAAQVTRTQSLRSLAVAGTGSVAEAAALAAAGLNSRLLGPRVVSHDGMATAAIAEGEMP